MFKPILISTAVFVAGLHTPIAEAGHTPSHHHAADAWTSVDVRASALVALTDAMLITVGDSTAGDTKDAATMDEQFGEAFDLRIAYKPEDCDTIFSVGAKHYYKDFSKIFTGIGISNSIGLQGDELNANSLPSTTDITRSIVEVDFQQDLLSRDSWRLGTLFGARAGHIKADAYITNNTASVHSKAKFTGVGPRFGLYTVKDLSALDGLSVNWQLSFAPLVGEARTETAQSTEDDTADWESTRVMPLLDSEFALTYQKRLRHVELAASLGAQLEWWSNGPDHFRASSSSTILAPRAVDYFFAGPFAEFSVRW